jgi:glycosyltransferase involved in cell wall biosynthesis
VLELVQHLRNGLVVSPSPKSIAASFDLLFQEKQKARAMGMENLARIEELKIDWGTVIEAMTA